MLASIHPLGERSRNNSYRLTAAAYVLGASTAAAALGLVSGLVGQVLLGGLSGFTRAMTAAVLLVGAGLGDLLRPPPSPSRQVDEYWLRTYRGWVYGLGFGAQLGAAHATAVSSWAVHALWPLAALTTDWRAGALVGLCFGASRGLTLLMNARVDEPQALDRLFERLGRWEPRARRAGAGLMIALGAGAGLAS